MRIIKTDVNDSESLTTIMKKMGYWEMWFTDPEIERIPSRWKDHYHFHYYYNRGRQVEMKDAHDDDRCCRVEITDQRRRLQFLFVFRDKDMWKEFHRAVIEEYIDRTLAAN